MRLYEPIYPDYLVRVQHGGDLHELEPNGYEGGRFMYDLPYAWLNGTPITLAVKPHTSPDGMFLVSNRPDENHPVGILRREEVVGLHREGDTQVIEPITPGGELDVLDQKGERTTIYLSVAMDLGDIATRYEQAA